MNLQRYLIRMSIGMLKKIKVSLGGLNPLHRRQWHRFKKTSAGKCLFK